MKPDPVIVMDASSPSNAPTGTTKEGSRRGGLRRFLSPRRSQASVAATNKPTITTSSRAHSPSKVKTYRLQKVDSPSSSKEMEPTEVAKPANVTEAYTSSNTPLKVEIGTRYIPIEEEKSNDILEDNTVASIPSFDEIYNQFVVLQERVTSGTMEAFKTLDSSANSEIFAAVSKEESPFVVDNNNNKRSIVLGEEKEGEEQQEEQEHSLATDEAQAAAEKEEEYIASAKNEMLLFQLDDVPVILRDATNSFSIDNPCSFDWGDKDMEESKDTEKEEGAQNFCASDTADTSVDNGVATSTSATADAIMITATEVEDKKNAVAAKEDETEKEDTNEDAVPVESSRELTQTKEVPAKSVDEDPSLSFLNALPEFLSSMSSSFPVDEACTFDWSCREATKTPDKEPALVKIESFEEYDDNSVFEAPLLLHSPNKDLDVFSIGSTEETVALNDTSNTDDVRGMEVTLTLPEF